MALASSAGLSHVDLHIENLYAGAGAETGLTAENMYVHVTCNPEIQQYIDFLVWKQADAFYILCLSLFFLLAQHVPVAFRGIIVSGD